MGDERIARSKEQRAKSEEQRTEGKEQRKKGITSYSCKCFIKTLFIFFKP
jgi:hypothetical protein